MPIVTDNKSIRLQGLKGYLLKLKLLGKVSDDFFITCFQPRKKRNNHKNAVTFTRTDKPNHQL